MRAYRVDAFHGAITDTVAVFFDYFQLQKFISTHPYSDSFGYVEIEFPDSNWNALFGENQEEYTQVPHENYS